MYRTPPPEIGQWQDYYNKKYNFKQVEERKELVFFYLFLYAFIGEGNGTPLQYSCLENPTDGGAWWAAVHGVARSRTRLSDITFTFRFHALEKEMATHSSVLAWRIPGTGEPGGLPSMGSHRVRHDWSDLAAYALMPIGLENLCWPNVPAQRICSEGDGGMWITSDESMYIYSLWNTC